MLHIQHGKKSLNISWRGQQLSFLIQNHMRVGYNPSYSTFHPRQRIIHRRLCTSSVSVCRVKNLAAYVLEAILPCCLLIQVLGVLYTSLKRPLSYLRVGRSCI